MIKLATILALLLSSTAQAANIDIQWAIQSYPSTTAQVGDNITFTWGSGHTVNIYPSGTCDSQGAILISETPPATYTFTAADVNKDLFFACGVSGHCDAGQHITVSVVGNGTGSSNGATITPSSVPMVSGSGAPTAIFMENLSAAPTVLVGEGGVVTPAPTPLDSGNETFGNETEMPSTSPMQGGTMGPSAVGGTGTQSPTTTTTNGSSSSTRAPVAGFVSAMLAMALVGLIE